MNEHHTKRKGDLGVLKVQIDLFEKGYWVSVPLTENAPFDLIATKDGVSKTIQVKYRAISNTGVLSVGFRNSWADKNGTHITVVDKNQIDVYCVYCPDNNTCYYFNPNDFDKRVTLRVNTPKNNQSQGIIMAEDYKQVP